MTEDSQYEKTLAQRASYDPAAFQTLYELYFDRVYRYVVNRIGHPEDAEDVVSEIFVQVIKGLPKFRNRHAPSFAAWIFTIARNTIIDFYRRKGRTPQHVALGDLADEWSSGCDPYRLLVERENRSELRTLLQQLPDRRREVVTLRYFAGLRNLEIADVMGIDERTVASHLSRGLKDLYEAYVEKLKTRETDGNAT